MTSQHQDINASEEAVAGHYECVSCGYVLKHQSGTLPTCPNDEGHHTVKAWRAVDSNHELHPSLPNSPLNPAPTSKPRA